MRVLALIAIVGIGGCASGPQIRSDHDPEADFSAYRTYNFVEELGTDRAGYSTLVTSHFKRAVNHEMEARGYRLDPDPDLLVNFFTSMVERTETRRTPGLVLGTGYYSSRLGVYTVWPLYGRDSISTSTYRVGTASIDVVDARQKRLIWEGVAEGRLTKEVLENPGPAIEKAVGEIFERYPAQAVTARQAQ
jgi:hypothetical protein